MSNTDKLREIAYKHAEAKVIWNDGNVSIYPDEKKIESLLSDLTALISENYVEKAKYDELLRQRDELREALEEQKRLYFNLFDEDVSCMYCEVKLKRGSAIILCKECAESTEV